MIRRWMHKWWAFLRPVPGWKERLLAFRSGQTAWEVPGRPECNKVIPWPVEWIPHRMYAPDEQVSEEQAKRGFALGEAVCVDTGKVGRIGEVACCARCGVTLHPDANRTSGFKPPACRRCATLIAFTN